MIEKNDGRLENFNREKIIKGLKKACQKRPVSLDQMEEIVDRLEKFLEERTTPQVSSDQLGEFIMASLKLIDPVSYVRFASFYWDYVDVEGFVKTLKNNVKSQPQLKGLS
jgi:transcriptional repressor NrdR